jgi:hypothetical protein
MKMDWGLFLSLPLLQQGSTTMYQLGGWWESFGKGTWGLRRGPIPELAPGNHTP